MSEMIERVARGLAGHNGYDPDDMSGAHNIGGPLWMAFVQEARVAIAAMRTPTQAMLDTTTNPHCVETMDDIRDVWTDMIDAALRETSDV